MSWLPGMMSLIGARADFRNESVVRCSCLCPTLVRSPAWIRRSVAGSGWRKGVLVLGWIGGRGFRVWVSLRRRRDVLMVLGGDVVGGAIL